MREKILNIRIIEIMVFVVIWTAVFALPFFFHRIDNTVNWGKVYGEWIRMSSFLVLFLLNTLVLVPKFLYQKKYRSFILTALFATIAVVGLTITIRMLLAPGQPMNMPPMELGPGMPPMELGPGMPPPMGYQPVAQPEQKSLFMLFLDNFIIAVLVVGISTSFKMVSQWLNEENKRKDLEKEQLKTQLALLRHQVSPHFFYEYA